MHNKYNNNIDVDKYKFNSIISKCNGELIPIQHEGVKVCRSCGVQHKYIIENDNINYKEPPKEVCF